ncbi:helix-turn-helix domain-containing protein [Amycolatopsis sp. NPDC051758]|uniref:helix-turn-helix domain-containing protein n=1 Tax=Amycolatopsis sp. NPDC051758 TaxID=3363935 RepID=UPI00379240FB
MEPIGTASQLAEERTQRNARLLAAWNYGKPIVELAREFDLSLSWTGTLLRKLGANVPKTGRRIKCQLDDSAVVGQYESGSTVREVAVLNGMSYGKIYRLLQEVGVSRRPRGGRVVIAVRHETASS